MRVCNNFETSYDDDNEELTTIDFRRCLTILSHLFKSRRYAHSLCDGSREDAGVQEEYERIFIFGEGDLGGPNQ